ncbi:MAG: hypothetical protein OEW62_01305 [Candidatus Bathyarchaeota archaeon]|nr:hypothetical protein [Candidatus Bathyarchaeota archaeon]
MGKYIVGFDTISYYIPVALRWVNDGVGFFEFIACAPLFYVLLVQLGFLGVPFAISLKILPPILLGCLGLVVFVYARKVLAWSSEKSLGVSCLATLYFVALRISWDMLRNELGLILLFVFLILLHINLINDRWKHRFLLLPVMLLVVLSHQLVAVIMFAVIFAWVLRKMVANEHGVAKRLVLCSLPAALLFALTVYASFVISLDLSVLSGFPGRDSGGWFSLFGFSSYLDMVACMLGFFVYCYLPLLPFMLVGIRQFKNVELRGWFCWCLVGALSSFSSPYTFLLGGYRWTLMLVFPVAFFVVEGLGRLNSTSWRLVFSGVLILLSFSFALLPVNVAFPYFRFFPYHVPSSMLQNSVPLSDCDDVVDALSWVGNKVGTNGVLLVHDTFHGWALMFLDREKVACYGYGDPEETARKMFGDGYNRLYVVWWVPGEGWHGVSMLPSCFVEVFRSNRIAVYEYNSAV